MPFSHRIGFVTVVASTRSRRLGSQGRRDLSGEAGADRHADALPDFFLDAACGAGDEVALGLVEEQHRRGVGLEDVLHPREQLDEQVVDVQPGERRVGHPLQPDEQIVGDAMVGGVGHRGPLRHEHGDVGDRGGPQRVPAGTVDGTVREAEVHDLAHRL